MKEVIYFKPQNATFTVAILKSIAMSPFSPVSLKESFAADVLTSMSRVLTNGAYTACYFASGAVVADPAAEGYSLHNFGACTKTNALEVLNVIFFVVPFMFRFLQCVRIIYEKTPEGSVFHWPQSLNAFKYLFSIVITLSQILRPLDYKNRILFGVELSGLVFLTLFTFLWDCIVDWGLLQPTKVQKVNISIT